MSKLRLPDVSGKFGFVFELGKKAVFIGISVESKTGTSLIKATNVKSVGTGRVVDLSE